MERIPAVTVAVVKPSSNSGNDPEPPHLGSQRAASPLQSGKKDATAPRCTRGGEGLRKRERKVSWPEADRDPRRQEMIHSDQGFHLVKGKHIKINIVSAIILDCVVPLRMSQLSLNPSPDSPAHVASIGLRVFSFFLPCVCVAIYFYQISHKRQIDDVLLDKGNKAALRGNPHKLTIRM